MIRLVIKRQSDHLLWLTLSSGFRFILALIGLILLIVILFDQSKNTGEFLWGVGLFLCLTAACYYEKWIFDLDQNKVERHFGLVFLYRRKSIPLETISHFTTSHFVRCRHEITEGGPKKGVLQKDYAVLSLATHDDRIINLEISPGRYKQKLVEKARVIAEFCEKPLR